MSDHVRAPGSTRSVDRLLLEPLEQLPQSYTVKGSRKLGDWPLGSHQVGPYCRTGNRTPESAR